jgi:prepilin-type processing-associated H-X9-DG protein
LLLPAVQRAQGMARRTQCIGNMKTIAVGCMLFSAETNGVVIPLQMGTPAPWNPPYPYGDGGPWPGYAGMISDDYNFTWNNFIVANAYGNTWSRWGCEARSVGAISYTDAQRIFLDEPDAVGRGWLNRYRTAYGRNLRIPGGRLLSSFRSPSSLILIGDRSTSRDQNPHDPPAIGYMGSRISNDGGLHIRHTGRTVVSYLDGHVGTLNRQWGRAPGPPPENIRPFRTLGARAAEEAVHLAAGQGPLVIITWNRASAFMSGGDLLMKSFMDTLADMGDVRIAGTEQVSISM